MAGICSSSSNAFNTDSLYLTYSDFKEMFNPYKVVVVQLPLYPEHDQLPLNSDPDQLPI